MKQFILPLTEPVGAVWALMAAGTVWLLFRKQWKPCVWLALPTTLLFVLGSTPLIEALVGREEAQWRDYSFSTGTTLVSTNPSTVALCADVVVVLGGGVRISEFDAHRFAADDAFSRILAGVELVRSGRARDLVLGGSYPMPDKPDEPGMVAVQKWLQKWAVIGGVSLDDEAGRPMANGGAPASSASSAPDNSQTPNTSSKPSAGPAASSGGGASTSTSPELPTLHTNIQHEIANLGICLDTHDEAVAFKKLKQFKDWNSVILVTSALHMRRAKALFEHTGIKVRPVAADFEVDGVSQELPFSIFPRMYRLHLWGLYLHEKIGMIAYRNKGWI